MHIKVKEAIFSSKRREKFNTKSNKKAGFKKLKASSTGTTRKGK
jgi:hypothetical protein